MPRLWGSGGLVGLLALLDLVSDTSGDKQTVCGFETMLIIFSFDYLKDNLCSAKYLLISIQSFAVVISRCLNPPACEPRYNVPAVAVLWNDIQVIVRLSREH